MSFQGGIEIEGELAHKANKRWRDNPYPEGTQEHDSWHRGWKSEEDYIAYLNQISDG